MHCAQSSHSLVQLGSVFIQGQRKAMNSYRYSAINDAVCSLGETAHMPEFGCDDKLNGFKVDIFTKRKTMIADKLY